MGVTAKTYTIEDVNDMKPDELRIAVPEILKAYNATKPKCPQLWEVYHEAALKLDAANTQGKSHTEYRENFAERQINKNTYYKFA